jgi:CRISPR-associated endonuclease/helicase Cas3
MKKAHSKSERLYQVQLLLSTVHNGISRAEIAQRVGASRATITRDIAELSLQCPIVEDERTRKLSLEKVSFINNIFLNTEEIQSLHLACRLLARKVRFHNPAAASALRKLGQGVVSYAPYLTRFIIESAELFEMHQKVDYRSYNQIIKNITDAMTEQKEISFERYSRTSKAWITCTLAPFCIEPYAEGNTLYLVGLDTAIDEMRTYKLELIRNVCKTEVLFTIPEDFSLNSYFQNSWGIWTSKNGSQKVILKFSKAVKDRVLQTEWHTSEAVSDNGEEGLLWEASIDEPIEMLPWIRGWGADVEVIKPVWLREKLITEIKKMASNYTQSNVKRF